MKRKEIEAAAASKQPVYWHEVTLQDNRWHQVEVVGYDAKKRRWRIQALDGIRLVGSGDLFPQIVPTKGEVFLETDGLVYRRGRASVQDFERPLLSLWHQVQKGKQPIEVQEGSTVWKRDALLVMAQACGRGRRLDNPESLGLPTGSTYAQLATKIQGRVYTRL